MKSSGRLYLYLHFIAVALILISGFSASSNEDFEADNDDSQALTVEDSQDTAEKAAVATSASGSESIIEAPAQAPVTTTQSPDFEDFLEAQSQELPSDSLGQVQVRTAGVFGARADRDLYFNSELTHGFSGISNYVVPRGSVESLKDRISQRWGFDIVFGQILVKTLVSYVKASQAYGNNTGGVVAAYQAAFTAYNGDTQRTPGRCTGKKSVQMREEYACDVIQQFNRMNAQWNRYVLRSTGKDMT